MRIKMFTKLAVREAIDYQLKNSPVVIDGFNYFYNIYEQSRLPFAFGCECDKLAIYIRERLIMFQKANVTCYFVFKGGTDNIQANVNKCTERFNTGLYHPTEQNSTVISPNFTFEVCKHVLEEMGFKYTVCKMDSKEQCIALARELDCPIISNDIYYCFFNVQYINYHCSFLLNETNNSIQCSLFTLNRFLKTYPLTKEKLALFILLTDETMFPEGTFTCFFTYLNIPLDNYYRNDCLLKWLSSQPTRDSILYKIFKFISIADQNLFLEKENEARSFIDLRADVGIPAKYIKGDNIEKETVEDWFEYLVASQRIPEQYINLYTDNFIKYNRAIQDPDLQHAFSTALDIVKFAFSLLTTENNDEFKIYSDDGDLNSVKVDRNALKLASGIKLDINLMKNNFEHVAVKEIFEAFFKKDFDTSLQPIPDDAKLLIIALSWCKAKNENFTSSEVVSVLLSYAMLNVVSAVFTENGTDSTGNFSKSDHAKIGIALADSLTAKQVLRKYFTLSNKELIEIFNRKNLHPLVEFQYCLQHFNYLNTLCGEPYEPTVYSKTYNGTFVYRVLYEIKNHYNDSYLDFLCNLKHAPGIVAFVKNTLNILEELHAAQ